MIEPTTEMKIAETTLINPRISRMAQLYNAATGCEYTAESFEHDLERFEPNVSAFKAGWDASESEAKQLLAEIIATRKPFLAAHEYLNITP